SGRTIGGEDGSGRDRPEHRTGEAPDPGAELRRERALVENEAADGVHEREAVRPGTRRGSRSRADIGDRGRELRVERLCRRSPCGRHDLLYLVLRRGDVRAGHVQLERRDRLVVESRAKLGVFLRGEPSDGYPHGYPEVEETRKGVAEEAVDPGIGEPDRVEHAEVRL